ncbi:MAG: aminotransferase class V-fold PLP-dependent enzyme [Bacteroidia bacterium]
MKRRNFLGHSAAWVGALSLSPLENSAALLPMPQAPKHGNPATDEAYWDQIRLFYAKPKGFINLENGYFSPQALPTLYAHQKLESDVNTRTSWFMRREQEAAIESSRQALATFLGVPAEELALTRNTTESLNTLISGYPWRKGDEVVIGNQDYGSMVAAFQQAEKRFGIVIKVADVPLTPFLPDEVVKAYSSLFTANTRMVHLTHLINLTGQVIPVAQIASLAHEKGIEVAVDAAHSVAHLDFKLPDLQADYVGASLHKWLCNPIGVGFLWMKKSHIQKIWPLMGDTDYPDTDMRKFEHQGTRPIHSLMTLPTAIALHHNIGSNLKMQRLKYLMRSCCERIADHPGIAINTPWNREDANSAIVNVAVKGFTPQQLADRLLKEFSIFTVAIDHPAVKGVRITPHVFTSVQDVVTLADALIQLADKG